MYEIFYPRHGTPLFTVPFRWTAVLYCRFDKDVDYARHGEGW